MIYLVLGERIMMRACAYSDDHRMVVHFDAEDYFKDADKQDLIELAKCGFGGGYSGDIVARFYEGIESKLLSYGHGAFECYVHPEDGLAWIRANKPSVAKEAEAALGDQDTNWAQRVCVGHPGPPSK